MKVVVNKCYGGFGISELAEVEYAKLCGFDLFRYEQVKFKYSDGCVLYKKIDPLQKAKGLCSFTFKKDYGDSFSEFPDGEDNGYFYGRNIYRSDPNLVKIIESLGEKANGYCAELVVVEIPDGVEYEISEYDGFESIHEVHRSW